MIDCSYIHTHTFERGCRIAFSLSRAHAHAIILLSSPCTSQGHALMHTGGRDDEANANCMTATKGSHISVSRRRHRDHLTAWRNVPAHATAVRRSARGWGGCRHESGLVVRIYAVVAADAAMCVVMMAAALRLPTRGTHRMRAVMNGRLRRLAAGSVEVDDVRLRHDFTQRDELTEGRTRIDDRGL